MASNQSVVLPVNTSATVVLSGSDAHGYPLDLQRGNFAHPRHFERRGSQFFYVRATSYLGADSFTFKVNNGYPLSPPR